MTSTDALYDFTSAVQEQLAVGLKQAQDINLAVVDVLCEFAALVQSAMAGDTLLEGMPSAATVIDQSFDFSGKLLDLQRDHAVSVIETFTTEPVPGN